MKNNTVRSIAIVVATGMLTSLSWAIPATSGTAAATSPYRPSGGVTGGGIGFHSDPSEPVVTHTGTYSSFGQLGQGRFVFQDGNAVGTARFTRSDGRTLTGTTQKKAGRCGAIPGSAYCLLVQLQGTADIEQAFLELTVTVDFGHSERTSFLMTGGLTFNRVLGYAMVDAHGASYTFGGIEDRGDATTSAVVTDIALARTGEGYWMVNAAGQVFSFDAGLSVEIPARLAPGETVTSMSPTPANAGMWLFTSRGRVIPYGVAHSFGDLSRMPLNRPIVDSIATPTGKGYYMVASDGGVFAFGDAKFRGSTGNIRLNQPVVGVVPTPDNTGYWLVASDGGVFSFNAPFHGSMGGIQLNRPVVAMVGYGTSYLMVASDGGIFNFSQRPFFGSNAGLRLAAPIVGAAGAS